MYIVQEKSITNRLQNIFDKMHFQYLAGYIQRIITSKNNKSTNQFLTNFNFLK